MSRYAAALSTHPVAFEAVGAVAGEIIEQLDGDRPDLLVCFMSRHHVARFTDIVIQDGSSFALKPTLSAAFPGRFTTIEPAAVEVHATYSGFADEVSRIAIAPDAQAERPFLPDPATLRDRLLLADRGYPGVDYFEAVAAHGGSFIIRLTRSYDPWVRAAWIDGRRTRVPKGLRLSRLLARHAGHVVDVDVAFTRGSRLVECRVVALPGRESTMTRCAPTCLARHSPPTSWRGSIACDGRSNSASRSGSRTPSCIRSTRPTRTSRPG